MRATGHSIDNSNDGRKTQINLFNQNIQSKVWFNNSLESGAKTKETKPAQQEIWCACVCEFVSVKISYQVFSRHEQRSLEEGNQRKETWTSHNTSSLARRFRIIDTTFSLCNCELWPGTCPKLGDKTLSGPVTICCDHGNVSTKKTLVPCKMTVYNPNLSRSPLKLAALGTLRLLRLDI